MRTSSLGRAAGARWRRLPRWARRSIVAAGLLLAARLALQLLPAPSLSEQVPPSTAVYDARGRLLRLTLASDGQYRIWTPLDQIAPALVEATLLYEDRHFFRHPGVNPVSLVRAAASTYGGGRRIGGSTLTMQLARRLHALPTHTVWGKLRQLGAALVLDARYSKRALLEAYLNVAPYGGNLEGIGAAAHAYFGVSPRRLGTAEALTLALVPQNPARRARAGAGQDPELTQARVVLQARWREHHGAADDAALQRPVSLVPTHLPFAAPHLVDQVLASASVANEQAPTSITTTLDLRLQRLIERHVRAYIQRQRTVGLRNAAALLVDTRTMAVRALVGSADFFDEAIAGQVDGTRARRSPGSALKPFAYALAFEQGVIHPMTMLRDVPHAFGAYSPENFDGRFAGPLPARDALIRSRNIPALFVAARLNRPGLHEFLRGAGIDLPHAESHYGLGLVLGTGEVTMQELVTLYAALANHGVLRPLRWRESEPKAAGVRVLGPEASFLVLDILGDNPRPAAPRVGTAAPPLRVRWKTGTSWGFRDAWAVGLFGPYALAVWIGNFSGEGNPAFVGVQAAAPLFFELVDSMVATDRTLAEPAGILPGDLRRVEVCALSGGLPTPSCPHKKSTWFIPGRSPIEPCTVHRTLVLDARGRRLCGAAAETRAARTEVFERWPSDIAKLFALGGLPRRSLPPYAPGCEDVADQDATPQSSVLRISSPLAGVTYTFRASHPEEKLALQAAGDGDAATVFWFADAAPIGKGGLGGTLFWRPEAPGPLTLRAVDDQGRSDARAVRIEVLP